MAPGAVEGHQGHRALAQAGADGAGVAPGLVDEPQAGVALAGPVGEVLREQPGQDGPDPVRHPPVRLGADRAVHEVLVGVRVRLRDVALEGEVELQPRPRRRGDDQDAHQPPRHEHPGVGQAPLLGHPHRPLPRARATRPSWLIGTTLSRLPSGAHCTPLDAPVRPSERTFARPTGWRSGGALSALPRPEQPPLRRGRRKRDGALQGERRPRPDSASDLTAPAGAAMMPP